MAMAPRIEPEQRATRKPSFYVIDRTTGKLVSADPFVSGITWATSIDLETGRPNELPNSRYEHGPFELSPGLGGAHGIAQMAYNRATGLVYMAVSENSQWMEAAPTFTKLAEGPSNTGVISRSIGAKSYLTAFDPATGETAWRKELTGGGALTTASGLVFQGRGHVVGEMAAYRASHGQELWSSHAELGDAGPGHL
jgi:quinohemoprotein ethanol dehydrogenase